MPILVADDEPGSLKPKIATPRTDTRVFMFPPDTRGQAKEVVDAEFARGLERELADLVRAYRDEQKARSMHRF